MTDPTPEHAASSATPKDVPGAVAGPPRKLRFHVLRHDPRDPQSVAHTEVFDL